MKRGNLGRRILPVAMTATLMGTVWAGLPDGTLISGAYAQRPESKEEEDRRKGGQPRQERPAPRSTPASPPAPRSGGRDAERPKGSIVPQQTGPARPDRAAPIDPRNPPQQRAAPQPDPRPNSGFGKATPPTPPQQRAAPQPDPRPNPGFGKATPPTPPQQRAAPQPDPRPNPGVGKSAPPTTLTPPPRQAAPQPGPLPPRDDPRRAQDRQAPKQLPGSATVGERPVRPGARWAAAPRGREKRPRRAGGSWRAPGHRGAGQPLHHPREGPHHHPPR